MGDRTTPFTVIKRTKYTLGDLSRFLPSSSSSLIETQFDRNSEIRRPRSSNRATWSPTSATRTRHHSLLSVRTYFAFGARSRSVALPLKKNKIQSSASEIMFPYYSSRNSRCLRSTYVPSNYDNSLRLPRLNTIPTLSSPTSAASTASLIAKYSRSSREGTSLSSASSGYNSATSSFSTTPSARSPLYSSPSSYESKPLPKYEFKLPKTAGLLLKDETLISTPSPSLSTISTVDRSTSTSIENLTEISANDDILKKNKELEDELAKLRLELRNKERTEHELRRKMLESEAEAKVWRTKCEHLQPSSRKSEATVDPSIIEKLDSAAERLSQLNVTNHLKMLQNEMESALKEISQLQ